MTLVTRSGVTWDVTEPGDYFWKSWEAGTWEPKTLATIDRLVRPGSTFVDIGAWIGPTAMWGARLASRVIAVEPDPVALLYLCANVAGNAPNVLVVGEAISDHTGLALVQSFPTGQFGDSMTHLSRKGQTVRCWTLPDLFAECQVTDVSLVKMDIEGGEAIVLEHVAPFLASLGVPLLVSQHGDWCSRPIQRSWFDGYSTLQGEIGGWDDLLALP